MEKGTHGINEEKDLLDDRLTNHNANPNNGRSWDSIKSYLQNMPHNYSNKPKT
ncbi:hypothetical protein [Confluentibacter lentus]|uniref:hypothetical protein n=1 Tax=Confluentibacter lentus TaxID=1699412 RepID=UPI0012FDD5CF|nr:hypothetical protein [Confluentibacter lentus]